MKIKGQTMESYFKQDNGFGRPSKERLDFGWAIDGTFEQDFDGSGTMEKQVLFSHFLSM